MYSKILVPVDLGHLEKLSKALNTAIDIARHYKATLHYVTVTNSTPSSAAHSTRELEEELGRFAEEQGKDHGIDTSWSMITSPDTAVELEKRLVSAVRETGADLVVMASHVPGIGDKLHFIHSNAANLVKDTDVSVFVVR
ncbi:MULTISPECIES: universal stress protein [Marinobacter]|uniref:Nucleotide-binding universal stress protein, UspA family n=1 Tax=Marinobacter segnicrescens TaxID=430453 RepID=A0A1H9YJ29_9GAMM|nr:MULTISPECIES: universal stress protein [Marinobacter]UZD64262.1 universal stress protein [Marinobacter sp. AN1]SES68500.1 Nucleotide-binding universal stress protein, UspA family [Marinobacter segnicrescens]